MVSTGTPKAGLNFTGGLVLGLAGGFLAGVVWMLTGAASIISGPSSTAGSSTVAGSSAASSGQFQVKLGRGHAMEASDIVSFPVELKNTGDDVGYVAAHCSFYGPDGTLMDTGLENFNQVAAGATVSGSMYVHLGSRRFTYSCYGGS